MHILAILRLRDQGKTFLSLLCTAFTFTVNAEEISQITGPVGVKIVVHAANRPGVCKPFYENTLWHITPQQSHIQMHLIKTNQHQLV